MNSVVRGLAEEKRGLWIVLSVVLQKKGGKF
jgi:hypothetical protein